MATRIQLRRDTAANWTSNNPTLANGEMGVETDTFKFKIGNGSTAWNALQYASSTSSYADSDVNAHLNTSTAASGEYLSWNGSDYSWDSVSAGYADSDVGAHLNVISAVSGQFLSWNGTDFAWSNNPLALNADIGSPPSPDQHFEFDGDTTNAAGSDALTLGTSVTYGTGYDGTANSAVILNSSKTVTLNSPSITAEDDDFFIGLWFKSDGSAFPTNGALLSTGFSGSNLLQIMVTVNDDTTPSLSLADYTSGWTRAIASTQPTWTDWNHYAISRSGDSVYLYLNGVPVATQSASGDTYPTGLWLFGRYTTTVGGSYDDWRFYASSPITHNTEFNPEAIGGSSVKIAEIQATGNTTNSTLTFKQYESGVLTSYPIYKDTSVDAHLNVDSATSGQFLSWDGTDYAWDSVSASPWTDNTSYVTYVGDVVIGRDISPDNINSNWKGITVAGPSGGGINFQNSLGNQLAGRIFGNLANLQIRPGTGGNIQLEDPSGADVLKINNDKTVQFAGAFTFPNTDGTANQVLTTNGSGTVTWADVGGGGLDSAAVAALIDSDLQNPTTLTIGNSSSKIVIGSGASTSGSSTVSVGINSTTSANSSVAVGSSSNVSSIGGVAIGLRASATGVATVAVGGDADATTGSGNTAFGHTSQATATGGGATSIGSSSNATGTGTTAIGRITNSSGTYSTSLGYNARTSGNYSIAIGADTTASGNNSISISAGTSSFTNSNVNGIDIRTSDSASIHYSQDSDFVFGAGVTMTDLVSTGATIVFNNLPTSDPVNAGQLWNDAGTLKVSAG